MSPIMPDGIGALAFAFDETGVTFFALFAFVWTISGIYAALTTPSRERARLFAYYLPSAVGGIAVALAADAISFYLCFALMAIPAWGLITHPGTPVARRAGAIYLTLTAISEALLLAALVIMAVEAGSIDLTAMAEGMGGSPLRDTATILLLASIGLKIGALPVSGILPLTYTYTPAGAASALAGASVKVGALAMVRLLPLGSMPEQWTSAAMILGLATAFSAAILGTLTTTPRAVLGYSSASQMGLILVAAGTGLSDPSAVPLAYGAVIAFSLHHGLAKSALVLGDDLVSRLAGRARTAALGALTLPALALAGAPLTSGFVAKYALKDAVHALHGPLPEVVYALLPWTAIGTAALMLRFLSLVRDRGVVRSTGGAALPSMLWGVTLVCVAFATWLWPAGWNAHAIDSMLSPSSMWTATWPVLVAVAGWVALRYVPGAARRLKGVVQPGDVLLILAGWAATADRRIGSRSTVVAPAPTRDRSAKRVITSVERRVVAWTTASTIFVLLALLIIVMGAR